MSKNEIKPISHVKYIGGGAYIQGVPARDLTAAEWAALPEDVKSMALLARLYEIVYISPKEGE